VRIFESLPSDWSRKRVIAGATKCGPSSCLLKTQLLIPAIKESIAAMSDADKKAFNADLSTLKAALCPPPGWSPPPKPPTVPVKAPVQSLKNKTTQTTGV
jgi:hypothetical protein